MAIMKLRPHHILDIISGHGQGARFEPHPYGHAVHTVAEAILSNVDTKVELVVGADEICRPCKHLRPDGLCDDILSQLDPPISKQGYNDDLDRRLLAHLGLEPVTVMTVRHYLEVIAKETPGIEKICTHPEEDPKRRLDGLTQGLAKLGIRKEGMTRCMT